jgi:hypothetical protein
MSKRSVLYSHLKQETYEETVTKLLSVHKSAKDIRDNTCSRPMKLDTAQRIAGMLHKKRV